MDKISIGSLYKQKSKPHFVWCCGKRTKYDRTEFVPVFEHLGLENLNRNLGNHFKLQDSILFVMMHVSKAALNKKNNLIPLTRYDVGCHIIAYQYKNMQAYCRLDEYAIKSFLEDWQIL